jgi:N-acylneuraminate cytidylyltransferase
MQPEHRNTQVRPVQGKRVLALITARGGSKGLPRKNVLLAAGKPLVAWTVDAAISAECVERVVLSSDDHEIMDAARSAGCDVPFCRPAHLASDVATSIDVVLHALDQLPGYEYVVLLQPTSPLRTAADIDAAFELMIESGAPSCVSVCDVDQSPYWMYKMAAGNKLERLLSEVDRVTRRQDLPPMYVLNGAIYIAHIDWLRANKSFVGVETVAYLMPKKRSLDIDTAQDFELFRSMIEGERYSLKKNKQSKIKNNDRNF